MRISITHLGANLCFSSCFSAEYPLTAGKLPALMERRAHASRHPLQTLLFVSVHDDIIIVPGMDGPEDKNVQVKFSVLA